MDNTFYTSVEFFNENDELHGVVTFEEDIEGRDIVIMGVTDYIEQGMSYHELDVHKIDLLIEGLQKARAFLTDGN